MYVHVFLLHCLHFTVVEHFYLSNSKHRNTTAQRARGGHHLGDYSLKNIPSHDNLRVPGLPPALPEWSILYYRISLMWQDSIFPSLFCPNTSLEGKHQVSTILDLQSTERRKIIAARLSCGSLCKVCISAFYEDVRNMWQQRFDQRPATWV